jgi:hypothetical protein
MATVGQFYWPSVGISVAAYGQFFMAANSSQSLAIPEFARQHWEATPSHTHVLSYNPRTRQT